MCGVLAAYFSCLPSFLLSTDWSTYALYLLMFVVGMGIGADEQAWQIVKQAKIKIILVPLTVIVGSLIGVSIAAFFTPNVPMRDALAIGSGFGYYSLSSIIISEISGQMMGIIALLANILREIITLLLSPFLARYFGKLAPITAGGATAMDTTLPIITKSVGKEFAIISLFSGIVLTIVVPFLLSFILEF